MAARRRATRITPSTTSWRRRRLRHCERSEAIQLVFAGKLDCFVASLLAMTVDRFEARNVRRRTTTEEKIQSHLSGKARRRKMPVRQGRLRDRRAGALGLARSFRGKPARPWRGLRHLCRQLAQALSHHQRQGGAFALRGRRDQEHAQLLRELRHACHVRARPLTAHGEHPARAVYKPHRPRAALSQRDRGTAGLGLYRRATGAAEGLSRLGLAALEKEKA